MRIIALTLVVVGIAVLGDAQTVAQTTPKVSAINIFTGNGKLLLRNNVQIQIGDADIRADEAEWPDGSREVTLRGNVRLIMPPLAANPTR